MVKVACYILGIWSIFHISPIYVIFFFWTLNFNPELSPWIPKYAFSTYVWELILIKCNVCVCYYCALPDSIKQAISINTGDL